MGEQAQRDLARGGGFRRDGSQFLCRPFGWIARERSQNVLQTIAREQPGNQRPVPLDPRRGRYHVAGPQELVDIVRLCSDRGLYARERRRRQIMARQQIGRASCRERESPYVLIPVVAVSLKKKKNEP